MLSIIDLWCHEALTAYSNNIEKRYMIFSPRSRVTDCVNKPKPCYNKELQWPVIKWWSPTSHPNFMLLVCLWKRLSSYNIPPLLYAWRQYTGWMNISQSGCTICRHMGGAYMPRSINHNFSVHYTQQFTSINSLFLFSQNHSKSSAKYVLFYYNSYNLHVLLRNHQQPRLVERQSWNRTVWRKIVLKGHFGNSSNFFSHNTVSCSLNFWEFRMARVVDIIILIFQAKPCCT